MHRWFAIFLLSIAFFTQITAKEKSIITIQSNFQSWSGDSLALMQGSVPIELYVPINRDFAFFIMTGGATVRGSQDNIYLTRMTDITDTQVGLNYQIPDANLLLNLGMNLPTGKKKLTSAELTTIGVSSQPFAGFYLPNIGQGFNISPGITWVNQTSDNVVLGLGIGYQYKSGYQLLDAVSENFFPGNEIVISGGLDIRTAPLSSLSFDLTYTYYMKDKFGSNEVYKSGSKIFFATQFKQYFGRNHLWTSLRFQTKSKGQVPDTATDTFVPEAAKTYPDLIELMGLYRIYHPSKNYYGIWGEIRSYMKPVSVIVAGIGFMPEIQLKNGWQMPLKIKIKIGSTKNRNSLFGFDIGMGLRGQF